LSAAQFEELRRRMSAHEFALSDLLGWLESNGQWALGIAQADNVPASYGRMGIKAHELFEALNEELAREGSRFALIPEYFADRDGGPSPRRRVDGSRGVDALVLLDGKPLLAVDLKTGRPWSNRERAQVEHQIGVPAVQIGPFVK
jgi:hypothetical protein